MREGREGRRRGLSIRSRLALGYTIAFAALLVVAAGSGYAVLRATVIDDVDLALTDAADAVSVAIRRDLGEATIPRDLDDVVRVTVDAYPFPDIGLAVFAASLAASSAGEASGASGSDTSATRLVVRDTASPTTRAFGGDAGFAAAALIARTASSADTVASTLGAMSERVLAFRIGTVRGPLIVAASRSLARERDILDHVRDGILVGVPLSLILAALGGYLLARASLRPVEAMRATAARMSGGTLHERLPTGVIDDELTRLAQTFNELLSRVESAVEARRRFFADASHELRTPVAVLTAETELALGSDRSADDYRSALGAIRRETRRLAGVVDDLFLLARTDAADQQLVVAPLYLEELVQDCVDAVGAIARTRRITIGFTPSAEVAYDGDERLLRRLVTNVLDNAVKYSPDGGHIVVEAASMVGGARVSVCDGGHGIPAEYHERVFDRFFRVHRFATDGGVGDQTGAGLGLPIVRWIASAHGGAARIRSSDARGTCVEVTLGAVAMSRPPMEGEPFNRS